MNRWRIPEWLEAEVRARDTACIYCGVPFRATGQANRRTWPTWEHIVNDARIVTRENIALCCGSCNASKGSKDLAAWLRSPYCRRRSIDAATVAEVARQALRHPPQVVNNRA